MTLHPIREDDDDLEYDDGAAVATVTNLPTEGKRRLPRTVYLSGPMRGRVRFNFEAFEDAAEELRDLGYLVSSPAEHDMDNGFDPDVSLEAQGFDLKAALLWDCEAVLGSDAVVTLPGWQHSAGATAEVALAKAAGLPVFELSELAA